MRIAALAVGAALSVNLIQAQGRGAGTGPTASTITATAPRPTGTPKSAAPIDLTGYWTAVVTEDWMFRMVTPPKGQFLGVPLNPGGRALANAWDPAKDEAAGDQCKAYGAAAVMRQPGRLHVTWQDDTTLKFEMEAGTQTRLLAFTAQPASGTPSWQGDSKAEWEQAAVRRGDARAGNLKVVTTSLKPGYLRKNGVPYSANAVVTEYIDSHTGPDGDVWLIVTTEVRDPQYLTTPFVTSSHFRKLPDDLGTRQWKPEACAAR
jgi:hypothetical protein